MRSSSVVIPGLDPATFRRHALNSEAAAWPETNCYIDVWLPLLHTLELNPIAMLPFCLAVDFEGDQWTFAKPSLEDLWTLYHIDVQELNLWDSLLRQAVEQTERGRTVLVELDSFYLPDTHGTSYRTEHTKTTIAINEIDPEARRMRYFHSGGYFEMRGDDFTHAMHLADTPDRHSTMLPPYAEFAKLDRRVVMCSSELTATSLMLARRHISRRPLNNPFASWRGRFVSDMEMLVQQPAEFYHRYAFANLRQIGAAFQLAAVYLRWLDSEGSLRLGESATAFDEISDAAKIMLFKMARAMNRKKALSDEGQLDSMEDAWNRAYSRLPDLLDSCAGL